MGLSATDTAPTPPAASALGLPHEVRNYADDDDHDDDDHYLASSLIRVQPRRPCEKKTVGRARRTGAERNALGPVGTNPGHTLSEIELRDPAGRSALDL